MSEEAEKPDHEVVLADSQQVGAMIRAEVLAFISDEDPLERLAAFGHMNLSVGFLVAAQDALARLEGGNVKEAPLTATMVTHAKSTVAMLLAAFSDAIASHPDAPAPPTEEEAVPVH